MAMDREPKKPPFAVGTRLKYIGPERGGSIVCRETGEHVPYIAVGFEAVIEEVFAGKRGTLVHLRDEEGLMYDSDGEPIRHTTRDGYSVYNVRNSKGKKVGGRCIDPDDTGNWQVMKSS
jgi:YD repeat-containing protein